MPRKLSHATLSQGPKDTVSYYKNEGQKEDNREARLPLIAPEDVADGQMKSEVDKSCRNDAFQFPELPCFKDLFQKRNRGSDSVVFCDLCDPSKSWTQVLRLTLRFILYFFYIRASIKYTDC